MRGHILRVFGPDARLATEEARQFAKRLDLPTRSPHRLVRLAEVVERDLVAGGGTSAADLIELRQILDTLEAVWASPARWQLLMGTLRSPRQFDHQMLTIASLRVLESWGNATDLVPEGPTGDLVVHAPPVEVLAEVKAPEAMTSRRSSTTEPIDAQAIVANALRKSRAQRRGRPSSLILTAGFRVPLADLDRIAAAWSGALTNRPRRSSIAAGIAITLGLDPHDIEVRVRRRQRTGRPLGVHEQFAAELDPDTLRIRVSIRVGRNDSYRGLAPVIGLRDSLVGIRLP